MQISECLDNNDQLILYTDLKILTEESKLALRVLYVGYDLEFSKDSGDKWFANASKETI